MGAFTSLEPWEVANGNNCNCEEQVLRLERTVLMLLVKCDTLEERIKELAEKHD